MNVCSFVGNLTRDPEIRYVMGGGKAVVKFAIAVNHKTSKGDDTLFLDCIAWEKKGETINQYFKKGKKIAVTGRLVIRAYEDKNGDKRKATELVINDFSFVEKAENSGGAYGAQRGAGITQTVSEFEGDTGFDPEEIPF